MREILGLDGAAEADGADDEALPSQGGDRHRRARREGQEREDPEDPEHAQRHLEIEDEQLGREGREHQPRGEAHQHLPREDALREAVSGVVHARLLGKGGGAACGGGGAVNGGGGAVYGGGGVVNGGGGSLWSR